ncbi:SpoIID/LytB domain-containing protein [Caldithrix abyssi]|nr:SpoIID/LytB domain-containing protein [Caldithrix abyssi]
MLKPGIIPKTDPPIRVGIILPDDEISSLKISFSEPQCYEIETNHRVNPSCKNKDQLSVQFTDGRLVIPELGFESSEISILPAIPDENPFIRMEGIPAGRGFHWEKKIKASFWGKIEFKVFNGKMVAINELPLEQYLKCVATSEMSAKCPPEFLKAQTIVARSWLLANIEQKHRHLGFDVCNDDCCQRYQGMANCSEASIQSADDTFGQVIMFDNQICDTRYSKSCGGVTERFENVWDGEPIPYLTSGKDSDESGIVYCSPDIVPEESLKTYIGNVDEKGLYYRWTYETTQEELIESLKDKRNVVVTEILKLIPGKIGDSGRIIDLRIEFLGLKKESQSIIIHSEYEIRNIMSPAFLYSSAFTIQNNEDGSFTLHGCGWGHGVGLCQIGALGMAFSNYSTEQILKHYYPCTELKTLYH